MIVHRPCPMCGTQSEVEVEREAFNSWRAGALVQDAFPDLSVDQREILITGTCSPCWERLWKVDPQA